MNKIFALWHNEMLKSFRKVSTILLLIAILISPFAIGGLIKAIDINNQSSDYTFSDYDQNEILRRNQEQVKILENELDAALKNNPENVQSKKEELSSAYIDLYQAEQGIKYGIDEYDSTYRYELSQNLAAVKAQIKMPDIRITNDAYIPKSKTEITPINPPDASETLRLISLRDRLEKILSDKNYADFCALKKDQIDANPSYSDQEKQIYKSTYDLLLKADPNGINTSYDFTSCVNSIENDRISILKKVYTDDSNRRIRISKSQADTIQNRIDVNVYKIESGIIAPSDKTFETSMSGAFTSTTVSLCGMLLTLLVLIAAGSCISNEISTGSIKSLIISPTRRWKIFVAKFLNILSLMLIGMAVGYIGTTISGLIFFGQSAFPAYISASHGVVSITNGFVYLLLKYLVDLIPILIIASFAMLLSTCTRNTAISVGIALVVYYMGNTVIQMLRLFGANGEWIKFIPFTNLVNLQSQFFPFSQSTAFDIIGFSSVNNIMPSLTFTLCYLAVTFICLIYTAFDSFTRRDI